MDNYPRQVHLLRHQEAPPQRQQQLLMYQLQDLQLLSVPTLLPFSYYTQ